MQMMPIGDEFQAGQYFGEMSLLGGHRVENDICAVNESTLIALDVETFESVLGPYTKLLEALRISPRVTLPKRDASQKRSTCARAHMRTARRICSRGVRAHALHAPATWYPSPSTCSTFFSTVGMRAQ